MNATLFFTRCSRTSQKDLPRLVFMLLYTSLPVTTAQYAHGAHARAIQKMNISYPLYNIHMTHSSGSMAGRKTSMTFYTRTVLTRAVEASEGSSKGERGCIAEREVSASHLGK